MVFSESVLKNSLDSKKCGFGVQKEELIDRSAAESVWSPHFTNRFLKSPLRALIIFGGL